MLHLGGLPRIVLILSYVFDWIVVIAAAGTAAVIGKLTPNKRPFSVTDLNISFPQKDHDTVSQLLNLICSIIIPACVIFLVVLFFVSGSTTGVSVPKSLIWRRKVWEWHIGGLGLALSLTAASMITSAAKNLVGKPRPDFLQRCQPDLNNIANYILGFDNGNKDMQLVNATICQNSNQSIVDDGFRSFPSSHSSSSAAGLIYLSLFLASKFAAAPPFLRPTTQATDTYNFSAFPPRNHRSSPIQEEGTTEVEADMSSFEKASDAYEHSTNNDLALVAARNQGAAPPIYLVFITVVPTFATLYISASRYSDFKHGAFDILAGFLIGVVTAVFSFRLYHLPISRGAGWAWGPRNEIRSCWAGVGVGNHAAGRLDRHKYASKDVEMESTEDVESRSCSEADLLS